MGVVSDNKLFVCLFVNQSTTNNFPTSTESDQPTVPLRKSRRNIQRPIRFKDYLSPDSVLGTSSLSSDENHHHKIKRILAKKIVGPNVLYLVQIKGELAQNSI